MDFLWSKRTTACLVPVVALAVASCGNQTAVPAIDPALRQSANTVAAALSDGDAAKLGAVMVTPSDQTALAGWFRGRQVGALASASTDDVHLAQGLFELTCQKQTRQFWLQFRQADGAWKLVTPADDAATHVTC